MALTLSHVILLCELRKQNVLPQTARIMEFGEQNWFGDVSPQEIVNTAGIFQSKELDAITQEVIHYNDVLNTDDAEAKSSALFKLAELYYRALFTIEKYEAIDLHGTPRALKHDLNHPLPIKDTYNIVTNFGTGEHVFNQYSFFKNMHDLTEPGGLMLHSMPNQGCYDHGFFNYHPTFIYDLAEANHYSVAASLYVDLTAKPATLVAIGREKYVAMAVNKQLSPYSALLVCLRKNTNAPFVIPQQGYYSDHLPENLQRAWTEMER